MKERKQEEKKKKDSTSERERETEKITALQSPRDSETGMERKKPGQRRREGGETWTARERDTKRKEAKRSRQMQGERYAHSERPRITPVVTGDQRWHEVLWVGNH